MPVAKNLTDQRFGHLVALQKAASRSGKTYWLCRCDCGNEKEIQSSHLISGAIQTCGKNCKYHQQYQESNITNRRCLICGKLLESDNNNRKYCYICSPQGDRSPTPRAHAMKLKLIELKGGKCERCGYDKCMDAFEFHHINPDDKEYEISQSGALSFLTMLKEATKCNMLCANCHREKHWEERQGIFNKIPTNNDLVESHINFILTNT